MTRYSAQQLRDGAVRFFGAFDFDERPAGISPRRLPAWTRAQLPKALDDMLRMPSGVRMAFTTDSRLIRLFVQTTRLVTPPQPPRPRSSHVRHPRERLFHRRLDHARPIRRRPAARHGGCLAASAPRPALFSRGPVLSNGSTRKIP